MPKKTETISATGYNTEDLLALSYETFLQLNWIPRFAGPLRLIGYTKMSWGKPHETITAEAADETVSLTSELPQNAAWDLLGKNKKNIAKFSAALDGVKASATAEQLTQWRASVDALRDETTTLLETQRKEKEEVEKVMNLSTGSKAVTYSIMALNVLVFVAMVIAGISAFAPTNEDLVTWGANFKPFTVDEGQWWRLLTCAFLHVGIVHLLFNMYALYMVGVYLEPMLGRVRYGMAYLFTAVLSSATSLLWHGDSVISAGASGAIFGLYGVFLALLTTNLIPKAARKALLQSIGIFVVYNLAYGLKSGIDNAAHLGGLISGFLIGYVYYFRLKNAGPAASSAAG